MYTITSEISINRRVIQGYCVGAENVILNDGNLFKLKIGQIVT